MRRVISAQRTRAATVGTMLASLRSPAAWAAAFTSVLALLADLGVVAHVAPGTQAALAGAMGAAVTVYIKGHHDLKIAEVSAAHSLAASKVQAGAAAAGQAAAASAATAAGHLGELMSSLGGVAHGPPDVPAPVGGVL